MGLTLTGGCDKGGLPFLEGCKRVKLVQNHQPIREPSSLPVNTRHAALKTGRNATITGA